MDLNWLEDFLALAESGNFSRAAEARHVTQPAFSRRIRALEEWAGTPLFVRGAQRATLTPAGELFARSAPAFVRSITNLRREARELGSREGAMLHFAATHALSFTFFPHWIRGIEMRAAVGAVRLVSDSMQACEELMLQGQAQFLLCHRHLAAPGRFEPRAFRSVPVGHDALVPFCAPDSEGAPRWRLEAGGVLPLLAYSSESGLGRILAAQHFKERAPGLETRFEAHLAATLLGLAREGSGIAWLPASLADQDLACGVLVRAGGAEWEVPVEIHLFRPAARQTAAAERFWSAAAMQ
ncbi:LysR family transcriptional regulator [Sphingomonas sp. dw_22]|uniref:LysR family transcriptional regulator n=1 Tax=Sphingomonas sp. dw_22 TaxID=2721175 RepID=UPI001BD321E4|nr:LysR family transcriptional regulator [Sphingomonas sp. dw_22]